MRLEKIRAYLLDVGDRFMHTGSEYVVAKIDDGSIYFKPVRGFLPKRTNDEHPGYHIFSVNSRELIMLIDDGKNEILKEGETEKEIERILETESEVQQGMEKKKPKKVRLYDPTVKLKTARERVYVEF